MLIVGLVFIVLIAVVLTAAVLYLYWWRIQRPVPNVDEDVELDGLQARVEIVRDRHGIPHIYAESDADLFRALGYVHAQDRLWQMEQRRRAALGRLAEVFGEAALDADRFSRTIGFGRTAQAELSRLRDMERAVVDAYVEGINAYARHHPGRLAAEFNLLRVQPEPWSALDVVACLKFVSWTQSGHWESDLVRLLLVARLGVERTAELDPGLWPAAAPDAAPTETPSEASYPESVAVAAERAMAEYERIRPWLENSGPSGGSNSWALSPRHSATRTAVLASDTHQGVQIPVQWYEAHLSSPGYKVSGATIPGIPGVWNGHNELVAWGMAGTMVDVQDVYVERQNPENANQFEADGAWYDAEVREERIEVRGRGEAHAERVRSSRHGPLLDSSASGLDDRVGAPFSLCWSGHEPADPLHALLALNRAGNWETFRAALAEWSGAPLAFTFADRDGNVGYAVAGHVPMRPGSSGLLPAPGWDSSADWDQWIPSAELPNSYNPSCGYVIVANQRLDAASPVSGDFDPGWRAARLQELIVEKDRPTLRDIAEMQMDTGSGFARELAPWFGRLEPSDSYEKVAAGLLRAWDYRMAADSSAATVFQYAWRTLLETTYGDKLGDLSGLYMGGAVGPLAVDRGFALRSAAAIAALIEAHTESFWYTEAATGRTRDRHEILSEAFTIAVKRLRMDLGDNARRWEWGRLHQTRFNHPLGSARMLRTYFNRGPYPVGGDSTTPMQTGTLPILPTTVVQVLPNYRQILDTADWERAQSCVSTGQSGHPLSGNYADQIDMWREGAYHAMSWNRTSVDAAAVHRMTLRPGAILS